jgi:hypothetical protein
MNLHDAPPPGIARLDASRVHPNGNSLLFQILLQLEHEIIVIPCVADENVIWDNSTLVIPIYILVI